MSPLSRIACRQLVTETLAFRARMFTGAADLTRQTPTHHDTTLHRRNCRVPTDKRTMLADFLSILLGLVLFLSGCSMIDGAARHQEPLPTSADHTIESVIARVRPAVERTFDSAAQDAHATIVATHRTVDTFPARHKHHIAVNTLTQPWDGLVQLEARGHQIAGSAARGIMNLPELLASLTAHGDLTSPAVHLPTPPTEYTPQDLLAFMAETIRLASVHRSLALAALSGEERQFLFSRGQSFAERYTPQISVLSDPTMADITANARFAELLEYHVDFHHLVAAAMVLSQLTHERWLTSLSSAFSTPIPHADLPVGITGDVLLVHHTPEGIIVIGGPGPNTYQMDGHIALLIDLGGNDQYHGMVAASADEQHGNAVVIDLTGDDIYDGAPLGLATGRMGIGLLYDRSGNDTYRLRLGSGGGGFGGLGILVDAQGHDEYLGERFTQGVAIGGLGLLVDGSGNDRYTSHGYAIGFGGPLGVGAVIDMAGNDAYTCGNVIPSAYNAQDAPAGRSDAPLFQYDCFGLGVGAGSRILTPKRDWREKSLAGGWGLLVDRDGNDEYHSANFSQGMGYFFGIGTLLDLNGHDRYDAARYGQGAAAHYGVALFIDHHGHDRYQSTGPYYNAGVAWDHGVSLTIDSGNGNDTYAFDQTTGLGKADHTGWAIFVDELGDDRYTIQTGLGEGSKGSLAGFIDLGGRDTYIVLSSASDLHPANNTTMSPTAGSIFADQ